MPAPERKPRGRPFQPGNPGRPPGSRNKTIQALEKLAEGQAEQVWQTVVDQALAGCRTSQRMFLERAFPPPKGQTLDAVLPPINKPEDVIAAIAAIWTALREGRLTPDQASALTVIMDRSIQAIELHNITKRVTALEEAGAKMA